MELVERLKTSLEIQGPQRAILDEMETFQRRVRFLVELSLETVTGEEGNLLEILEQLAAVGELAELKIEKLRELISAARGRGQAAA